MARPTKQGVDYFPLDVHLDDKFKFIEIKYKLEGFAILIKLMQKIYSCGYWCKMGEDEIILFADEIKADFDLVVNVINECLKRDVFNQNLYENHQILTSKGIQKRYKEIVRRRKDIEIITEYVVIDNINPVNDGNNSVNDGNKTTSSKHSDGKSTQSKVKESKVNKTKVKETKVNYAEFVSLTETEHQKLVTQYGLDKVNLMIQVLDNYKGANGKKYANDYRAILNWVVNRVIGKPKTTERNFENEIDPEVGF